MAMCGGDIVVSPNTEQLMRKTFPRHDVIMHWYKGTIVQTTQKSFCIIYVYLMQTSSGLLINSQNTSRVV